jgi:3-oxoadipate enol-lactonase
VTGSTARPAVVLLHPLGVDHRFWDPVCRALPPVLRDAVVAPDLLGHGKAPLPGAGATVHDLADAVELELAGHDRVHLVGVSLGGLVAQVVAARRPDLVERVVLADAVAVYPDTMQAMWRDRAATVRGAGLASVVEPMEALWFTEEFRAEAPGAVRRVRELLMAGDPEGYARTCELLADADTTKDAAAITAPVLVVCGEHDAPPFRAATEWFADQVADVSVVWLPGRHATAYEHPGAFADVLTSFLR